ncbi:hypothetical protein ACOAOT_22230 [Lacrimispora sp. AGF001]|uniref:hypothetical protein n=1 Tax=Lacrimispora sp. AGF001 TaxID=3401631 RepID=UPI003B43D372
MQWINESKIVYNEKDLKDAVKERYADIRVRGTYAQKAYEKFSKDSKIQTLSKVALFGGLLFWPLFIAGLAGSAISVDFSRYTMTSITSTEIILKLMEKYKKNKFKR